MSRHRMYQNYDYENDMDEYDGGEYGDGEEELSPEDKAQMAQGTTEVQASLGPQADKVTVQQIQEALWHYFYDVDKSVAYLVNKFIDPAPKATGKIKKAPQLKNNGSSSDGKSISTPPLFFDLDPPPSTGVSEADPWRVCAPSPSLSQSVISRSSTIGTFFEDMPWLNIPENRSTIFIAPQKPHGGLLGGSPAAPKMSKLQALAAARKKKAEEAKQETSLAISSKGNQATTEPDMEVPQMGDLMDNTKNKALDTQATRSQRKLRLGDVKALQMETPRPAVSLDATPYMVTTFDGTGDTDNVTTQLAQPSAFAQTLLPSASEIPPAYQRFYTPPYMAYTTPEALKHVFSRPSPDDVVLGAQSQAGKRNKPAPGKGATDIADDVKNLKVADSIPLPKSKNLDVLKEFKNSKRKKNTSFVVVGHVDSGKSTLLGRLLLDMKVVEQRTIDKYRKEAEKLGKSSFALAWVLDQRSEERSRGVTIDIATNNFETENTSFTLLDAPGHRDFIPNMLAGASLADFAVLVVDAAKGAFEAGLKGQTREHALLLRSMGVFRIIVVVNKLDTAEWDRERFDEIRDQVLGSLKALKFPAKDISFVPVSGLNGDNIVHRSKDPAASWYTGHTLLEELENSEPAARELERPLRMMISDLWDTSLSPVTVSGRIDAGSLQIGDALLVQPSSEKAYVKAIELNEEPVEWAVAGQHVTIHLSHIDESNVHIGDVICTPSDPVRSVDTFTMKALAFDTFFPMPVDLHRGRLHTAARIAELTATLDIHKGSIIKRKPQVVKAGAVARIVVKTTDGKVPIEKGQRVVLRSGGDTVAAGLIE